MYVNITTIRTGNTMTIINMQEYKFKSIAQAGDSKTKYLIGVAYHFGWETIEKNINEAVDWYTKSANLGYYKACLALSNCYENGIGVKKDIDKAIYWARKTVEYAPATHINGLDKTFYKRTFLDGLLKQKLKGKHDE